MEFGKVYKFSSFVVIKQSRKTPHMREKKVKNISKNMIKVTPMYMYMVELYEAEKPIFTILDTM